MNTLGQILRLTCFGESHGPAIGGVLDGMPAGIALDLDAIQQMTDRRRPGAGQPGATSRNEADRIQWLSGLMDGVTLGTPIAFLIQNTNAHSADYDALKDVYRPNHADYTYDAKYGIRDHRGGGRASARVTAPWVVAGAIAMQLLQQSGITIQAEVEGDLEQRIAQARAAHDSIGGVIRCVVKGAPAGLGEPVFGKLQARLAHAMLSINAVKGFEYGDGFAAASAFGSEQIDAFEMRDGKVHTRTNHSGGIQGGISNGEEIRFRVAFKPVATLMQPLPGITRDGEQCTIQPRGRHDICVVPRALPIVEAMTALVIADALLCSATERPRTATDYEAL